jgi:hypothetical protein
MQDEVTVSRLIIVPLKGWKSSNTYLGTTLKNTNSIQEEIKSRLKSGNAGYHSVKNLLSSSLLSKNLKMYVVLSYMVQMYVVLSYMLQMPYCWLEVTIRKVMRPATSAQVFLDFPVSKSEC